MGRFILNTITLKQVGIRLLPDEKVNVAVELEDGLTEELEQRHATLLLTNKRLIRYSAAGHRTNVISAALEDVQTIEVNQADQNRQWILAGLVFKALIPISISLIILLSLMQPNTIIPSQPLSIPFCAKRSPTKAQRSDPPPSTTSTFLVPLSPNVVLTNELSSWHFIVTISPPNDFF